MKKTIVLILMTVLFLTASFAQFGKNKIREDQFDWKIYSTENFDIYYYDMPYRIVSRISKVAENTLDEYKQRLNIKIKYKTPLILYLNKKEFSQTNVIDGFISENVGGFVELRKRRLVIPFNGDFFDFERVLRHELVHVFHYQYMYPSSMPLRELYRSISEPPLWLIEGMAEYFSNDWQPIGELMLRENILTSSIPSVGLMDDYRFQSYGYYSYKLAQSFVEYLADEYGEDKIVLLFKRLSTRINVDYKEEFKKIYGIKIETADQMWKENLKKTYWQDGLTKENPYKIYQMIDFKKDKNVNFIYPKLSFGNEVVALYANYRDELNILLINKKSGELIKNLTKGLKLDEFRNLKLNPSSLCWGEDGIYIYYIASLINRDVIVKQNILTKNVEIIKPNKIKAIEAIKLKSNKLFFIGKRKIYTNIYSFGIQNNSDKKIKKYTDDIYYKKDIAISKDNIFYIEKKETGDSIVKLNYEDNTKTTIYQTDTINSLSYDNEYIYFDRFFSDAAYICALDIQSNNVYQITESFNSTIYPDINDDRLVFNIYRSNKYQLAYKEIKKSDYTLLIDESFPEKFENIEVTERDIEEIKKGSRKYSIKIIPDYVSGSLEYNSGGFFRSYTTIMGMDMLGDYRFRANLDLTSVQKFEDIDFQLAFNYLKNRYSLGTAVYSWKDYLINSAANLPDYTERNTGIIGSIVYPLSYKDRIEFSVNYNRKSIDYVDWYFEDLDFNEYNVYLSYVRDSSRWWGYYHPLSGYRMRITYQKSFDLDTNSLNYGMVMSDFRHYFKFFRRSSFAQRLIYGEYWEDDAQNFKLGGLNTLRGYDYQSLLGHKILLYNAEVRFPVVDYLAFSIKGLNFFNIRGVLFYDMAFIGDSNESISIFDKSKESLVLNDKIDASVGYGIRLYLGSFLNLKFDWAWKTDLDVKEGPYFHFGIGSDF